MRILVVCGAGASSTFVAQRIRGAAQAAGLPWTADAGTESSVGADAPADLVLVGPHLADRLAAIENTAPSSARVSLLPEDVFADRDGTHTVAWIRDHLTATTPSEGIS